VDDFQLVQNESSNISSIAADDKGNVYAVGVAAAGSGYVGVLRKSANGGGSWSTDEWPDAFPNDVAVDDAGNVFVIAGTDSARVLWRSSTAGENWEEIDDIPMNPASGEPCNTGFVATGKNGAVVTGASCDFSGWIVRKSGSYGDAFEGAFFLPPVLPGYAARLEDVAVGANGEPFAVGTRIHQLGVAHWLTVTSGGLIVDDFQLAAELHASGRGFGASDASMVAGSASDPNGEKGVLRRHNGQSWSTLDEFPTMARSAAGVGAQIVVVGESNASGVSRVVTRLSSNDGLSFDLLDEYEHTPGQATTSAALGRDPAGNLYAAIGSVDALAGNRWIVRKLACQ
jgi:hypothetical protein